MGPSIQTLNRITYFLNSMMILKIMIDKIMLVLLFVVVMVALMMLVEDDRD